MGEPFPLREVLLDDKFDVTKDHVFLNGAQAIVRLMLMQHERDKRAGLNTAGYISGYRGSPVGGLDLQFARAKKFFEARNIVFHPGVNEDLAATAIWGTQQAELHGEGKYDGVFSLWYGKGPGVDRTGDVFRHGNLAGSSKHGGVLALMGDDHTAESSTVAHQSEFNFINVMMPILNPAGIQELIDFGLHGYALSRFSGLWVSVKCVKDNIESTASVDGSLDRVKIILPENVAMPPGGLNIRRHEFANMLGQEARLHDHKRAAAVAYIKANKLNRTIFSGGANPKIGIISTGKSYLDVRQALADLGIGEAEADQLGIRLFKVGAPWPVVPSEILDFARDIDLIIVVEEKRSLLEVQVREELYHARWQPELIGKRDESGGWLFPVHASLDPNNIAIAIGDRLMKFHKNDALAERLSRMKQSQERLDQTQDAGQRTPHFCSGCPHNTSTRVPDGARAFAGIGCHYMAQWMDRGTEGYTQMGGEGANWIGEAPFSKRKHMFQNLGDGTYNHSGSMAIRAALAANVTLTYKILFNDAVAMTGGQAHEGGLTVDRIARQIRADGVERIAIVTDEPDKYGKTGITFPPGATLHHRDDLDAVQRELMELDGVTALIYDQTCAAEKRRRRKRGTFPDPDKRVIINELVCEGCGDCGVQSNCVSIQPVETEFGRKRRIDQSNCNKDFSCVNGFCPSFVTVHGAKVRKARGGASADTGAAFDLPAPEAAGLEHPWSCIVTGVGGTGVVTIGAILGMAAHLEGKGCGMIDMAGLAQKGGAVSSHVQIAAAPEDIKSIRVSAGAASLVLGCDLIVTGTKKVLAAMRQGATQVVVNTAEIMPGDFTRNADFSLPVERVKRAITQAAGAENVRFIDANALAMALFGNSIASNMFMLGFAYQAGGLPLSAASLEKAIELNGEAVPMNLSAFRWGRRAAHDPEAVERASAASKKSEPQAETPTLETMISRRAAFLREYQNEAYAQRYRSAVERIRAAEQAQLPGETALAEAAARYLFKLMAYKDEYEVARLYTDGAFQRQLAAQFEGDLRLEFHLAPPILAKRDPVTGVPRKMSFGPWMMQAFRLLAWARRWRGTPLDVFGRTAERRGERALITRYEASLDHIAGKLTPASHAAAVALASIPEKIRGYGHVKERHLKAAEADQAVLRARFDSPAPQPVKLAAE